MSYSELTIAKKKKLPLFCMDTNHDLFYTPADKCVCHLHPNCCSGK